MNKNIKKYVNEVLKNDEYARKDDWYLIAQVFKKIPRLKGVSLIYALEHSKIFNLPSAESITRARRKLQDENPEYKAIEDIRKKEEKEYHNFYGGKNED